MSTEFSHFDEQGASRMVDVGAKAGTERRAVARGVVRLHPETLKKIRDREFAKGDVLEVARLAGIMAVKRTADIIPLCHPLPIEGVSVDFTFLNDASIQIRAEVSCTGKTGVEMEALVAVSATALTIYDMCKSVERGIVIERIQLEEKAGGRSGHWQRTD
jgi:cyclic pyranopterin phosphate synthase